MSEIASNIIENAEMTKEQLQFICTLLEENKPHKIVEVGVAAGGTSVVILDKLDSLNYEAQMYSVDLSREYYRDKTKTTGYLIDQYLCGNKCSKITHKKLTGDYIPNFLEHIGTDIDFLILDTVHSLPGEILDFLAILPFLSSDAVVILHDITLNHLSNNKDGFATQILLDCVVADKLTPISLEKDYPGIGAFQVNTDTVKYIDDVFHALMITWKYLPDTRELELYRNHYEKYYNSKQLYIFDEAVRNNSNTYKATERKALNDFRILFEFVQKLYGKKVYIYGNGFYGKKIKNILQECDIEVSGFIVSQKEKDDSEVFCIEEISQFINLEFDNYEIVIGVSSDKQYEIIHNLNRMGISKVIIPSEEILGILP